MTVHGLKVSLGKVKRRVKQVLREQRRKLPYLILAGMGCDGSFMEAAQPDSTPLPCWHFLFSGGKAIMLEVFIWFYTYLNDSV
jgi:hypothetical protein